MPWSAACLKPSYSLRAQLLLSFGSSALVTIAVVVMLAAIFASKAGDTVQDQADYVLQQQVVASFVSSSLHVAERLAAHMSSTEGALQLIVEATRDRLQGYPNAGWQDDAYVPFYDTDSETNQYPLRMPPAPLDWNITWNFGLHDAHEHIRLPVDPNDSGIIITTASGVYHMQGACDPDQTDQAGLGYYPNCTAAHNDIRTGGVVQPTTTNWGLHRVTGDLGAVTKAIFEVQRELFLVGIYFVNAGAGSALWYPGHVSPPARYRSQGCDWMNETNPYTKQPYATPEERARCHPNGTEVSEREYNALERPWFRRAVLTPDDVYWHGPFNALDTGIRMNMCVRSIFDRM